MGKMVRVLWTGESSKVKDGMYLGTKATVPSKEMGGLKEFGLVTTVRNPRDLRIPRKQSWRDLLGGRTRPKDGPSSAGWSCSGVFGNPSCWESLWREGSDTG